MAFLLSFLFALVPGCLGRTCSSSLGWQPPSLHGHVHSCPAWAAPEPLAAACPKGLPFSAPCRYTIPELRWCWWQLRGFPGLSTGFVHLHSSSTHDAGDAPHLFLSLEAFSQHLHKAAVKHSPGKEPFSTLVACRTLSCSGLSSLWQHWWIPYQWKTTLFLWECRWECWTMLWEGHSWDSCTIWVSLDNFFFLKHRFLFSAYLSPVAKYPPGSLLHGVFSERLLWLIKLRQSVVFKGREKEIRDRPSQLLVELPWSKWFNIWNLIWLGPLLML